MSGPDGLCGLGESVAGAEIITGNQEPSGRDAYDIGLRCEPFAERLGVSITHGEGAQRGQGQGHDAAFGQMCLEGALRRLEVSQMSQADERLRAGIDGRPGVPGVLLGVLRFFFFFLGVSSA